MTTTYEAPPALQRPPLSEPLVHRLDQSAALPKLDDRRDHLIILPPAVRLRGVSINQGRNVVIAGGYISIGAGLDEACISVHDGVLGRVVHLEGIREDALQGGMSDGLQTMCPTTHVQVQKCRTTGLRGSLATRHADVCQPLGMLSLSFEDFTGSSHYNSLYARRENKPLGNPLGPIYACRVNMKGFKTNPLGEPQQTLRAISLGTQPDPPSDPSDPINGHLTSPVWLYEYYADAASAGRALGDFAWPHAGSRMVAECRASVSADGQSLWWERWKTDTAPPAGETTPSTAGTFGSGDAKVYGVVKLGPPPGGDFVLTKDIGLSYPLRSR